MLMKKSEILGGISLAVIHIIPVVYLYRLNVFGDNSDASMGWLLLMFLDFSVSVGMWLPFLHVEGNYNWNNIFFPTLYFGALGTIWWFFVGAIIVKLVLRMVGFLKTKNQAA